MSNAFVDKNYIYAVSRIRYAELRLLDRSVFDRLCDAADLSECLSILAEKGFGGDSRDPEDMISEERRRLWELMEELVPDSSVFDVFRLQNDYQNIKAAIKESAMDQPMPDIYVSDCVVDPALVREAVRERRYKELPGDLAETAERCHEIFLRTRDGQLCDILVDHDALAALQKAAEATKDPTLIKYAGLTAASADIKIAVRAASTGKDETFLDRALAECSELDIDSLKKAAISGTEAVYAYLANTDFADAVPKLRESSAAFECWCDDLIIRSIKPQLWNSFGLGPLAAYILAKETELRSVRILLTARQNGFSADRARERVRETYV